MNREAFRHTPGLADDCGDGVKRFKGSAGRLGHLVHDLVAPNSFACKDQYVQSFYETEELCHLLGIVACGPFHFI